MAIDPWEALRVAVRAAHVQHVGPVRGAAVELDGSLASLNNSPDKGVITVYATRSATPGGGGNTYTLSDGNTPGALAAQVYWLPYEERTNQLVDIETLDRKKATLFLTSGLSGCHFLGCDGVVMHSPAQRSPMDAQGQMSTYSSRFLGKSPSQEFSLISAESKGDVGDLRGRKVYYGGGSKQPRAVVMGWKSQAGQWFFAYQELTSGATDYAFWNALGG